MLYLIVAGWLEIEFRSSCVLEIGVLIDACLGVIKESEFKGTDEQRKNEVTKR